jgi:hypothetical protein
MSTELTPTERISANLNFSAIYPLLFLLISRKREFPDRPSPLRPFVTHGAVLEWRTEESVVSKEKEGS